ncbi:MAG: hypothetical protein IJ317_05325 [Clostridia bacterium]|nr:hypothetical protein [Clostridia bacterium]
MVYVKDFNGTDNEKIEAAIASRGLDGVVVIDEFEAAGNLNGAFIVCGLSVFGLMLLHSATLIFSKEKPVEVGEKISTKRLLRI